MMKRHILVLAALLFLANWATADYLLIKIDFDQIPFAQLREGDSSSKGTKDKGPVDKGPLEVEPKARGESATWVYGIFEVKRAFSADRKPLPGNEFFYFEPVGQSGKDTKDPMPRDFPMSPPRGDKRPMGPDKGMPPKPMIPMNPNGGIADPGKAQGQPVLWRIELDQKSGKKIFPIVPGLTDPKENITLLTKESLAEEFAANKKREGNESRGLLNLAFWALKHGLTKEFHETMARLKKENPENPAAIRYTKISEEMKKSPAAEPQISDATRMELKSLKSQVSDQGHYIIYWKGGNDVLPALINRRLARLEIAYSNFFYWCALQDTMPLPALPKQRLAVLVEPLREFGQRLKEQGRGSSSASGVVLRRDNLLVLSSSPNNDLCEKLKINLVSVRQGRNLSPDELLTGSLWNNNKSWYPDPKTNKDKGTPKADLALLQTLALILDSMEDDVELSTISREGTAQLLGASGFLARNVAMPEWIQAGLVSYFEVPPVHLHQGFGQPRGEQLRTFQSSTGDGKSFKPAEVLVDLATDRYFRPGKKVADARQKQAFGQAASWALVYYLAAERKTQYLSRYAQLMNELPRHMVLHPDTLEACFTRGFNVNDPRDRERLDAAKWIEEMERRVHVENPDLEAFFAPAR